MATSVLWFVVGIVRWIWLWLPFLVLDLAGWWESTFQPLIFRLTSNQVAIPGWLVTAVWVLAIAFAAVRSYHSMRVGLERRVNALRQRLYSDDLRAVIRTRIAELLAQGRVILDTWNAGGPQHDDTVQARTHNWLERVDRFAREHSEPEDYRHDFRNLSPGVFAALRDHTPDHYRAPMARVRGYIHGLERMNNDFDKMG